MMAEIHKFPTPVNQHRRYHDLGYDICPVIVHDAKISPNSTLYKRVGTHQDGRGKTPGRLYNGLWSSYDWPSAPPADERDLERWHEMGAGVGIRTGNGLVGIDADTTDKDHAATIRDIVQKHIGRLPVRVGRYPKALYPVRVKGKFKYCNVEFGPPAERGSGRVWRVEMLYDRKFFVAEGIHPKTKEPYAWPREPIPFSDLPEVEPETLMAIMEELRKVLPDTEKIRTEGAGASDVNQESLKTTAELLQETVDLIPNNNDHFPAREDYRDVLYAIKASMPDDPNTALDIVFSWTDRWENGENERHIVEADFNRMHPPFKRGAPWLFDLAEKHSGTSPRAKSFFDDLDETEAREREENPFKELAEKQDAEVKADGPPPLIAGEVHPEDFDDLPPRSWLYGKKLLRKYVTFIASPGGVGKTAYAIAMALACATREQLLHDTLYSKRPLNVWILNLEDDIIELRRRLKAAFQFYGIPLEALKHIRLNSGRDRGVRLVKQGKDGFIVQPDKAMLIAEMKRHSIDLAIFDPFLRTHNVSENDSDSQDFVMEQFADVAEATNAAILLIHHTKKGAIAGDLDSMRGSSTQGGGARAAFTMAPMSIEEASKLGVPELERKLYVRIDDAKANMSPPLVKTEWLKLESVGLGNFTEEYPQGDSVQVASVWTPPDAWDGILEQEALILARLDAGPSEGERYSARAQDKERWAGTMLIEEFGRTAEQAKVLLSDWEKSKAIEVREYRSETQRKTRKGYFMVVAPAASVFE